MNVKKEMEDPVACGGSADVYIGVLAGKKVALKVFRFYPDDARRRKALKVSFSYPLLCWPTIVIRISVMKLYIGNNLNIPIYFHFLGFHKTLSRIDCVWCHLGCRTGIS